MDLHRSDAVRILDWLHAAQHLTALAEAVFGEGTPKAQRAGERLRRWLWEEGPDRVLAILAGWTRSRPDLASAMAYCRERRAQLAYPTSRAAGWPARSSNTTPAGRAMVRRT